MVPVHEAFHDLQTGECFSRRQKLAGIGRIQPQGLFTQDVLAGLEGLDRPFHVQVIGQWNVDGLDAVVGQQFFVGAKRTGNTEAPGRLPGPIRIARGDGLDFTVLALLHGRNDFLQADFGGAHDPPAYFAHWLPSLTTATVPTAKP